MKFITNTSTASKTLVVLAHLGLGFALGLSVGNLAVGLIFAMVAYCVIGNDSAQTLSTLITSNKQVPWWLMAAGAVVILLWVIWSGWLETGGDISHGRLNAKGYTGIVVDWWMAIPPMALLILTRFGVPVSTSLLMLSMFAGGLLFQKILLKSAVGYVVAFSSALVLWLVIEQIIKQVKEIPTIFPDWVWRVFQFGSTALLWSAWLAHDMVNMSVFLGAQIAFDQMLIISALFAVGVSFMFYERGGKIADVVREKSGTNRVIAATGIDLFYFAVLWYFKEVNDLPMSTTWVFLGLIGGRELAIRIINRQRQANSIQEALRLIGMDMGKLMLGLLISLICLVLVLHFFGS